MEQVDPLSSNTIQAPQPAGKHPAPRAAEPVNQDSPSQKPSKWLRVVKVINHVSAIIFEFFQPYDRLDRFNRPMEAIQAARWRSFNQ